MGGSHPGKNSIGSAQQRGQGAFGWPKRRMKMMNEETLNATLRKFLKKVGITSQREIEMAVRDGVADGRLKGNEIAIGQGDDSR